MKVMLKKSLLIGFFGLMAVAMLQIKAAEAGVVYINGIPFFFVGSIKCASLLKALGKKDAPFTLINCDAQIEQASFRCVNNGGNADNSGSHIFDAQNATVSVSTTVSSCQLDKITGNWHCDQTIGDPVIDDALAPFIPPDTVCPNRNFSVQVQTVTQMCPTVSVFSCVNTTTGNGCNPGSPNCDCSNLQDTIVAKCDVPAGSPAGTKYHCDEIQNLTQCVF
jgi:hypothetical protein